MYEPDPLDSGVDESCFTKSKSAVPNRPAPPHVSSLSTRVVYWHRFVAVGAFSTSATYSLTKALGACGGVISRVLIFVQDFQNTGVCGTNGFLADVEARIPHTKVTSI